MKKILILLTFLTCFSGLMAMENNTLYDILGVERDALREDIKKSYNRLAKKYHPDKKPHDDEIFKKISHAYNILSDSTKRTVYDQFGEQGVLEFENEKSNITYTIETKKQKFEENIAKIISDEKFYVKKVLDNIQKLLIDEYSFYTELLETNDSDLEAQQKKTLRSECLAATYYAAASRIKESTLINDTAGKEYLRKVITKYASPHIKPGDQYYILFSALEQECFSNEESPIQQSQKARNDVDVLNDPKSRVHYNSFGDGFLEQKDDVEEQSGHVFQRRINDIIDQMGIHQTAIRDELSSSEPNIGLLINKIENAHVYYNQMLPNADRNTQETIRKKMAENCRCFAELLINNGYNEEARSYIEKGLSLNVADCNPALYELWKKINPVSAKASYTPKKPNHFNTDTNYTPTFRLYEILGLKQDADWNLIQIKISVMRLKYSLEVKKNPTEAAHMLSDIETISSIFNDNTKRTFYDQYGDRLWEQKYNQAGHGYKGHANEEIIAQINQYQIKIRSVGYSVERLEDEIKGAHAYYYEVLPRTASTTQETIRNSIVENCYSVAMFLIRLESYRKATKYVLEGLSCNVVAYKEKFDRLFDAIKSYEHETKIKKRSREDDLKASISDDMQQMPQAKKPRRGADKPTSSNIRREAKKDQAPKAQYDNANFNKIFAQGREFDNRTKDAITSYQPGNSQPLRELASAICAYYCKSHASLLTQEIPYGLRVNIVQHCSNALQLLTLEYFDGGLAMGDEVYRYALHFSKDIPGFTDGLGRSYRQLLHVKKNFHGEYGSSNKNDDKQGVPLATQASNNADGQAPLFSERSINRATKTIKRKNACIDQYIKACKNKPVSPSKFFNYISKEIKGIEDTFKFISSEKIYYEMEEILLGTLYEAILFLFNYSKSATQQGQSDYSSLQTEYDAMNHCRKLCIIIESKHFYVPYKEVMPRLAVLMDQISDLPILNEFSKDENVVKEANVRLFGRHKNKIDVYEKQQTIMRCYQTINRFYGAHQTTALKHFYDVSKELLDKGDISAAYVTVEMPLRMQWQNNKKNHTRIDALKELKENIVAGEAKKIEESCTQLEMRISRENLYTLRTELLELQPWFVAFLKRIESSGQRKKYEQTILNLYYKITENLSQLSHANAIELIDAALQNYQTDELTEKFMNLKSSIEVYLQASEAQYCKEDEASVLVLPVHLPL